MTLARQALALRPQAFTKLTMASLFAGMGGFSAAFKRAGFQVTWANELDPYAIESYQSNFADTHLYAKSITDLSVVEDHLAPVDVLTAGFPCQPFSVAGSKRGFDDPRGRLFFEIVRLLREFGPERPKILLLENVKNLRDHNRGKTFTRVMEEIQGLGYWFMPNNTAVLNTRDHTDIPQIRERLFMAALSWDAFDHNDFRFPDPVPEIRDRKAFLDLDNPAIPELYFATDSKYGQMFVESMARGDPNSVYLLRKYFVRENKSDSFFTLTANMGEGGHNVPVIRDQWGIRKLTPKECMRLQGFKDDEFAFPETVSRTQQYKQVGNTVTVSLVEKLAIECHRKLSGLTGSKK